MVVRRAWAHPSRARNLACAALAVALLLPLLTVLGVADAPIAALAGFEFLEELSGTHELGHPPPRETVLIAPLERLSSRETSEPGRYQSRAEGAPPACALPTLFASVILLLMVPVGWMAPPGFHSLRARVASYACRAG